MRTVNAPGAACHGRALRTKGRTSAVTSGQTGIKSQRRVRAYGGRAAGADRRVCAAVCRNLAELPTDLAEAFEAFKLAILHHKLDGWQQVTSADVLASLEALKQLVVPSDGGAL